MGTDTTEDTGTDATSTGDDSQDTTATGTQSVDESGFSRALTAERAARRDADRTAKALKAELDDLRKGQMSDTEKAIADAREATRREVLAEVGASLVDAEVRAATVGRQLDADALLDGLDRTRFLGDDGKPDRTRISEWIDRIAPKGDTTRSGAKDLGQGVRPNNAPTQIRDRGALKNMTPQQIVEAHKAGQLDDLMRG